MDISQVSLPGNAIYHLCGPVPFMHELRGSAWGAVLLPGLLLLLSAPLIPASPDDDHRRLERELAAYSTQAQRCDLEAALDRYPDTITHELRDILASQLQAERASDVRAVPAYAPTIG